MTLPTCLQQPVVVGSLNPTQPGSSSLPNAFPTPCHPHSPSPLPLLPPLPYHYHPPFITWQLCHAQATGPGSLFPTCLPPPGSLPSLGTLDCGTWFTDPTPCHTLPCLTCPHCPWLSSLPHRLLPSCKPSQPSCAQWPCPTARRLPHIPTPCLPRPDSCP